MLMSKNEGQLISNLSKDQKDSLDLSYEERVNPSNLVDLEAVKRKYL